MENLPAGVLCAVVYTAFAREQPPTNEKQEDKL
jgi:hypothetical protein